MNVTHIDLTDAEWAVMNWLWDNPRCTGREITNAMQQKMDWSRSTTLTMLRRLESKGAVSTGTRNEIKTFFPLIPREEAAIRETESLLDRIYHGSLSLLVSSLTRKQDLPQQEIDELYAILKEMEERKHD